MAESMRYRLTDERARLMDQLRGEIDDLPESQWKADLLDMALENLEATIENHREFDGDPELAKAFNTPIVRSKYRTMVEITR